MSEKNSNKNLIIGLLVVAVIALGAFVISQQNKKEGVSIEFSEDGVEIKEH